MSPWTITTDIISKTYNYDPVEFKKSRIMVLKILSMKESYIPLIDDVNRMSNLSDKMFYDFLFYAIPKSSNTFIKWLKDKKPVLKKADKLDIFNIEYIMDYFKINKERAQEHYELYKTKI